MVFNGKTRFSNSSDNSANSYAPVRPGMINNIITAQLTKNKNSDRKKSVSKEAIILIAGAAGVTGFISTDYDFILDPSVTFLANKDNTSLSITCAAIAGAEEDYNYDLSPISNADAITINGNYRIEPILGLICYKKGTTATTGTIDYKIREQSTTATVKGDVNVDSTSISTEGLIGKVSGADFTTAYASANTITCASLPTYHSTLLSDDIVTIIQIDNTGAVIETYSRDDVVMSVTTNVITVSGAVFAATDTFVIYTNINRMTSEETPTIIHNGVKSVTTAGTAVALGASIGIVSVTIVANNLNTGNIYVGGASVTAVNGYPIGANDQVPIPINNLSKVYINSDVDGEGVSFIYLT